jgi:hypothetical protein
MNINRYLEMLTQTQEEPLELVKEREEKLTALQARLDQLQSQPPRAPWENGYLSPNAADIANIQAEIHRLTCVEPTYRQAFERGRAYERWRQGEMKTMKTNQPWDEPREWCIKRAAELWKADSERRIGDVSEYLHEELGQFNLWRPKRPDGVKTWLKAAAKEGRLTIPPEAQRPGCK